MNLLSKVQSKELNFNNIKTIIMTSKILSTGQVTFMSKKYKNIIQINIFTFSFVFEVANGLSLFIFIINTMKWL